MPTDTAAIAAKTLAVTLVPNSARLAAKLTPMAAHPLSSFAMLLVRETTAETHRPMRAWLRTAR